MLKQRYVYLEQGKTLTDSGTHTIEISPIDPISQLIVNLWADNGATSNKNVPIPRIISSIEVVDGANVIFSMDGRAAYALSYYQSKKMPAMSIIEEGGLTQSVNIPLNFGRWLWDQEYAISPTKFRNLQLKVTWDLAAIRAVGATGFITNTAQLSIIAAVMEGLETEPKGYIMSKDHYSWTTAASGDERVALPTDYPYALIMVKAWEAGVELTSSITNLKLNIDFDKFIGFDLETGDLENFMQDYFGVISYGQVFEGDDSEAHELWMSDAETLQAIPVEDNIFAGIQSFANGRFALYLTNDTGVAQTAKTANVLVQGVGIFNTVCMPFGLYNDPETYFNATEHGDIKLIATQGNAGAEANIILAQLRSYGK